MFLIWSQKFINGNISEYFFVELCRMNYGRKIPIKCYNLIVEERREIVYDRKGKMVQ